jgi:hypothetical protein
MKEMSGRLTVSTKFDTNKNQMTMNPVNNISVNVGETLSGSRTLTERVMENRDITPDLKVDYNSSPYIEEDTIKKLTQENEALKIIINMLHNNPIMVNKLIIADDAKLARLVLLLTGEDEVHIDADDIGSGCFTSNVYRKINAIYVIKNGNTKNLKYDYPDITKELKDLGINIKIVW